MDKALDKRINNRMPSLLRSYIAVYIVLAFLFATIFTAFEYKNLSNEKEKLAAAIMAVEKINHRKSQVQAMSISKMATFDVSARDDETLRLVEQQLELLSHALAKGFTAGPTNPSEFQEFYLSSIENELAVQEREYLAWLQELILLRIRADSLGAESDRQLEIQKQANQSLQVNEEAQRNTSKFALIPKVKLMLNHRKLSLASEQAAIDFKNIVEKLQRENLRVIQLQGMRNRYVIDEPKIQARLAPLYREIYQIREGIDGHWITKASQPSLFGIPLGGIFLIATIVVAVIANMVLGRLDRKVANAEIKPRYIFVTVTAILILAFIPMILGQLKSHNETDAARKNIADVKAKVEKAEAAEKGVIEWHADALEKSILQLREDERAIENFSNDMGSLKMYGLSVLPSKEEYKRRVTNSFYLHVISPDNLQSQFNATSIACRKDLESIENELLISLGSSDLEFDAVTTNRMEVGYEVASSVARVADESKTNNQLVVGATLLTIPLSMFVGIAVDLVAGKIAENEIKNKLKEEITTLSGNEKKSFIDTQQEYLSERNIKLKHHLGV